ncbi:hypothetical protein EYF80_020914 [Liparis tanakae]|uniref:Uncharacterized protein n=1 Tax=Liparis tanakae TaxID=230148 RepID=A0A4Z2HSV5_9TELE|nr:hypothetical protein EYF80_020914 [Liparis tanakae]
MVCPKYFRQACHCLASPEPPWGCTLTPTHRDHPCDARTFPRSALVRREQSNVLHRRGGRDKIAEMKEVEARPCQLLTCVAPHRTDSVGAGIRRPHPPRPGSSLSEQREAGRFSIESDSHHAARGQIYYCSLGQCGGCSVLLHEYR